MANHKWLARNNMRSVRISSGYSLKDISKKMRYEFLSDVYCKEYVEALENRKVSLTPEQVLFFSRLYGVFYKDIIQLKDG